jgi:hypothetical protein
MNITFLYIYLPKHGLKLAPCFRLSNLSLSLRLTKREQGQWCRGGANTGLTRLLI